MGGSGGRYVCLDEALTIIITGWNDKIVALEKTTWFHFHLMKTGFLFFCCRPSTSWPRCVQIPRAIGAFYLSESDSMFNERDRRCTAVQLMLCTDPSYDNRTIASTFKMQIRIATNNWDVPRVMKTKSGPHHATSHLQSWLESQHQSVPGCAEECGDPLMQSGGRW